MAIRAPDDALLDLLSYSRPRRSIANHVRNISRLVMQVVEVQKCNVAFATVHTGMRGQIVINAGDCQFTHIRAVPVDLPCIGEAPDIPGSGHGALTSEADPLPGPCGTRAKRKVRKGLGFFADATDSG